MKKTATSTKGAKRNLGISAFPMIILCFILAMIIYHFVYGNPANFINNDPKTISITTIGYNVWNNADFVILSLIFVLVVSISQSL